MSGSISHPLNDSVLTTGTEGIPAVGSSYESTDDLDDGSASPNNEATEATTDEPMRKPTNKAAAAAAAVASATAAAAAAAASLSETGLNYLSSCISNYATLHPRRPRDTRPTARMAVRAQAYECYFGLYSRVGRGTSFTVRPFIPDTTPTRRDRIVITRPDILSMRQRTSHQSTIPTSLIRGYVTSAAQR